MKSQLLTLAIALTVVKLHTMEKISEVQGYLQSIFPQIPTEQFKITPIASFTNQNYLVEHALGKYVLRIPGVETERFINRITEYQNAKIAFEEAFNPANIVYFDQTKGVQLALYVEGKDHLEWNDFYHKTTIASAVALLKKIHESDLSFQNDLNVFERMGKLISSLSEKGVPLPLEYQKIIEDLDISRFLLSLPNFKRVPCHNDPIPSNFVLTEKGLQLFDWEYSGFNDPAWELSLLSCVMNYSEELDHFLVETYRSNQPSLLYARLVLFKPFVELWIALWSFSQTKIYESSADFFSSFASTRLQKCKDYINHSEFPRAISCINDYVTNEKLQ